MPMPRYRFLFLFTFSLATATFSLADTMDSLRLETIDGKTYIIHQVDPGETLYSISKRYSCSMNSIAEASPDVKRGLHDGMILRVPYSTDPKPRTTGQAVHIVKQGETLYSISQIYNVSVIDIMEWNDLMSADLEIDQKLTIQGKAADTGPVEYVLDGKRIHVVQPGEGLYAIARQYEVSVDELVEWNELTSSALNLGQEIIVGIVSTTTTTVVAAAPIAEEVIPAQDSVLVEDNPEAYETEEKDDSVSLNYADLPPIQMMQEKEDGMAAVIEGEPEDGTFLGMHRSIPVGSLVAVRNEMNQQVVFVRIIGALPDTGINDKIIIRLSASAVAQLKAIDPKFRVEITYLVPEE